MKLSVIVVLVLSLVVGYYIGTKYPSLMQKIGL